MKQQTQTANFNFYLAEEKEECSLKWRIQVKDNKIPLSPVLLPIGDDRESVCVVSVTADISVPPGHTCRCSVILQYNVSVI